MNYLTLTPETIPDSHICCAISDKKCAESYAAKKNWLSEQYAHGYRFRRLDVRGKVFNGCRRYCRQNLQVVPGLRCTGNGKFPVGVIGAV